MDIWFAFHLALLLKTQNMVRLILKYISVAAANTIELELGFTLFKELPNDVFYDITRTWNMWNNDIIRFQWKEREAVMRNNNVSTVHVASQFMSSMSSVINTNPDEEVSPLQGTSAI